MKEGYEIELLIFLTLNAIVEVGDNLPLIAKNYKHFREYEKEKLRNNKFLYGCREILKELFK